MAVWTVYLSLCLLVAVRASGALDTVLEKPRADDVGREASEACRSPNSCWAGWSAYGCRCFKFFNNAQTWIDAENFCLDFDGNLASVHSSEEYTFIKNLIRYETQSSTRAWIGGYDAVQEGVWLWSDGSKMNFQIWSPGEPNNAGGTEHCIEMNYITDGNWNDDTCYRNKPFVCVKRTSM